MRGNKKKKNLRGGMDSELEPAPVPEPAPRERFTLRLRGDAVGSAFEDPVGKKLLISHDDAERANSENVGDELLDYLRDLPKGEPILFHIDTFHGQYYHTENATIPPDITLLNFVHTSEPDHLYGGPRDEGH